MASLRQRAVDVDSTPEVDRRAFERTPISLHGTYQQDGAMDAACLVMDVSPGGALIAAAELPDVGTSVRLNITGLGKLEGQVVRQTMMEFSVKFTTCADARKKLAASIAWQFNKRRLGLTRRPDTERNLHSGSAIVKLNDGTELSALVEDVTLEGAVFRCEVPPKAGTHVCIGEMTGLVTEVTESGFAVAFDPPSAA